MMRVFESLNIVAALLSLYYFVWRIEIHLGRGPGNPTSKSRRYFSRSVRQVRHEID
jgi:hypothetical protein